MNWIDICSYSDPDGSTCCAPGMENKEYLVVSERHDWFGHSVACHHYGGHRGGLVVLEERAEWSCVLHYVLNAWQPSFQRYAISLRAPFGMPAGSTPITARSSLSTKSGQQVTHLAETV